VCAVQDVSFISEHDGCKVGDPRPDIQQTSFCRGPPG
jgi:hypothetical protein